MMRLFCQYVAYAGNHADNYNLWQPWSLAGINSEIDQCKCPGIPPISCTLLVNNNLLQPPALYSKYTTHKETGLWKTLTWSGEAAVVPVAGARQSTCVNRNRNIQRHTACYNATSQRLSFINQTALITNAVELCRYMGCVTVEKFLFH